MELKILELLNEESNLQKRLDSLFYGSIEIRENGNKKYIYVHYREDGLYLTKYAGEYSDELYNLILKNNVEAKDLKKLIRQTDKQLKLLNYKEPDLDDKIKRNIDFARKHLAETIYKQAVLEGIATTYLDTETIIEGGKVTDMSASDVLKILNLKHAWEFILNKNIITAKTDFNILCDINKFVEEGFHYGAGQIRSVPVFIGGTNWKPPFPVKQVIVEELDEMLKMNTSESDRVIDLAIDLLLYVTKRQIFIDGNKRTAVIFANHFIISHGLGLIAIPENIVPEYKKLLIDYYENKNNNIKSFLKEKCYIKI